MEPSFLQVIEFAKSVAAKPEDLMDMLKEEDGE